MNNLRGKLVKYSFQLMLLVSILLSIFYATKRPVLWNKVFYDEFNGSTLDTSLWNTVPRWGRTDNKGEELQYYADDAFEVKDGVLRIKAEKRSMGGLNYTSGLIESRNSYSQTYGKFEIRAKVPKGQGLWPAFWLAAVRTWPPEIDVFEILGHDPKTIHMTNHWMSSQGKHEYDSEEYTGPDFSQDFHTYTIEWSQSEIIWFVDGKELYRTSEQIPSEPMYVIANLAVGGEWPGNPDFTTVFPSYFEIDYIRLYEPVYKPVNESLHFNFVPGLFKKAPNQ